MARGCRHNGTVRDGCSSPLPEPASVGVGLPEMSCLTVPSALQMRSSSLSRFHVKNPVRTRWGRVALCVVVVSTLAGPVSAQTTNAPVSAIDIRISSVEGKVEVFRAGAQAWSTAYTNQVLYVGDRVRVPERGRLALILTERSVARFGELSEFTVQPPATARTGSGFSLSRGLLYFFHRGKPADIDIKTSTAGAAVRGTEFNLQSEEGGRTILTMLDGEVEFSNDQGQVRVQSGEQGIAEPGRPPSKTAVINAVNVIQWALYYPAVLDLDELNLRPAEKESLALSLAAYRVGDLLRASADFPPDRTAESAAEKVYLGA